MDESARFPQALRIVLVHTLHNTTLDLCQDVYRSPISRSIQYCMPCTTGTLKKRGMGSWEDLFTSTTLVCVRGCHYSLLCNPLSHSVPCVLTSTRYIHIDAEPIPRSDMHCSTTLIAILSLLSLASSSPLPSNPSPNSDHQLRTSYHGKATWFTQNGIAGSCGTVHSGQYPPSLFPHPC